MNSPFRFPRSLIIILVASGCAKVAVMGLVHLPHPFKSFSPDSASYVRTARALNDLGRFSYSPESPDVPEVVRTPGYPAFLAACFWLFGERYWPILLAQIAFSLFTILCVYQIAATLWNQRAAICAALWLACDLLSLTHTQFILTETMFTTLLALSLYLASQPWKRFPLAASACCQSLCLSLAALTRPISYYLAVPYFAMLCASNASLRLSRQQWCLITFAFWLPWCGMAGGWQWRNYQVTGRAEFSYIKWYNLLYYQGAGIVAQRDGVSFIDAQKRLGYDEIAGLPPDLFFYRIAALRDEWKARATRLVSAYPWLLLRDQIYGAGKMLLVPGEHGLLNYLGKSVDGVGPMADVFAFSMTAYLSKWLLRHPLQLVLFALAAIYLCGLYVSALWAICSRRPLFPRNRFHLLVGMIVLYFVAFSSSPSANPRFRIPLMPIFSLYAGYGAFLWRQRRQDRSDSARQQ